MTKFLIVFVSSIIFYGISIGATATVVQDNVLLLAIYFGTWLVNLTAAVKGSLPKEL